MQDFIRDWQRWTMAERVSATYRHSDCAVDPHKRVGSNFSTTAQTSGRDEKFGDAQPLSLLSHQDQPPVAGSSQLFKHRDFAGEGAVTNWVSPIVELRAATHLESATYYVPITVYDGRTLREATEMYVNQVGMRIRKQDHSSVFGPHDQTQASSGSRAAGEPAVLADKLSRRKEGSFRALVVAEPRENFDPARSTSASQYYRRWPLIQLAAAIVGWGVIIGVIKLAVSLL